MLFDFLPLASPSTSRGVVDTLPVAAELPRGVEVGGTAGAEGREGREDTLLVPVLSSMRLWATLIVVSSSALTAGGTTSSTSISAAAPWKEGAEARREKGVWGCCAASDVVRGRLQAGAAVANGVESGKEEEGELLEGRGSSSLSSSEVGVAGSVTAASSFVSRFV